MIGKNVADRLNLNVGDEALVFSSVADRYLSLKIGGVFLFDSGMDDEVFVLLSVGQWLRFSDYNHVTLIRVKTNPEIVTSAQVYEALSKSVQNQTVSSTVSSSSSQYANYQSLISWVPINFNIDQLSVTSTQTIMKSYLDRYGVTKEALSILSVLVFLLSSLTVVAATQTLLRQHKAEVETLQFVGASKRTLKLDILFKLLPASFLACGLGAFIAYVLLGWLNSKGFLSVLAHGLTLSFDPLVLMLNFVLVLSLVSFGVLRSRFE
jgi:ABC-type lipoprotein release transport system permease subunit